MSASTATEPGSKAPTNVLVVEDEPLVRTWISDELRAVGHIVLEATSADEAMQILGSALEVQVVLTDVHMPGRMNGLSLTEWVRRERPEVKVIVMSSDLHFSAAHASLAKPFSAADLTRTVSGLLGLNGAPAASAG
jgi:CheY-like chemotaxis protein